MHLEPIFISCGEIAAYLDKMRSGPYHAWRSYCRRRWQRPPGRRSQVTAKHGFSMGNFHGRSAARHRYPAFEGGICRATVAPSVAHSLPIVA